MILTGAGPFPIAQPGPQGAGTGGPASRTAADEGTGGAAALPAAAAKRTGESRTNTGVTPEASEIRSVIATSRTGRAVTSPQDLLPRSETDGRNIDHMEHRRPPAPPLSRYASIPMEVTAEIQRLRTENAELKADLAALTHGQEALDNTTSNEQAADSEALPHRPQAPLDRSSGEDEKTGLDRPQDLTDPPNDSGRRDRKGP